MPCVEHLVPEDQRNIELAARQTEAPGSFVVAVQLIVQEIGPDQAAIDVLRGVVHAMVMIPQGTRVLPADRRRPACSDSGNPCSSRCRCNSPTDCRRFPRRVSVVQVCRRVRHAVALVFDPGACCCCGQRSARRIGREWWPSIVVRRRRSCPIAPDFLRWKIRDGKTRSSPLRLDS